MEKIDEVRKMTYKYVNNSSPYKIEALTKYVGIDKDKVDADKKEINDYYLNNFYICGDYILHDKLRYTLDNKEWIKLYDKESLDLFERVLAIGYASTVFSDEFGSRFGDYSELGRDKLKYLLPEEFEYIDENYYAGLNDKVIQNLPLYINSEVYDRNNIKHSVREIIEYWWKRDNVPEAGKNKKFNYLLDTNEDGVLNVATYMYMNNINPIGLTLELDGRIHSDILLAVDYIVKSFGPFDRQVFIKSKQDFLSIYDRMLNNEEINRGRARKKEL